MKKLIVLLLLLGVALSLYFAFVGSISVYQGMISSNFGDCCAVGNSVHFGAVDTHCEVLDAFILYGFSPFIVGSIIPMLYGTRIYFTKSTLFSALFFGVLVLGIFVCSLIYFKDLYAYSIIMFMVTLIGAIPGTIASMIRKAEEEKETTIEMPIGNL